MAKSQTWTKEVVQNHAHVAVAIEIYTLPFYITALASIKDTNSDAYKLVRGVMMEEMLHLELAANLCLALDTTPDFTAPAYGQEIPYLKPYDPVTGDRGFLNATLGPLNQVTLNTMLDIETPEELETRQATDHTSPQYPYNSIGQMYDALLAGIEQAGTGKFSWTTTNQQSIFSAQNFSQKISDIDDARSAINAINEQGEGKAISPVPTPPYKESDFPIESEYQLTGEGFDPSPINEYSHFGRFLKIKDDPTGLPETYTGSEKPGDPTNTKLQKNFADLITALNTLWTTGSGNIWSMTSLLRNAQDCWKAGVIPKWS